MPGADRLEAVEIEQGNPVLMNEAEQQVAHHPRVGKEGLVATVVRIAGGHPGRVADGRNPVDWTLG